MASPALVTGTDWDAWTPGSEPAAKQADNLHGLISEAVGSNPQWSNRAAARGSMLASIEDHRLDKLSNAVSEAVARGDSVDDLHKTLLGVLDDTRWADLVATTEMARAMTAASMATYTQAGAPGYSVLTASDDRVCLACNENQDGGPYPLGTAPPNGLPPAHPLCRCATVSDWSVSSNLTSGDLADLEDGDLEAEEAGADTIAHDTSGTFTDLAGVNPPGTHDVEQDDSADEEG